MAFTNSSQLRSGTLWSMVPTFVLIRTPKVSPRLPPRAVISRYRRRSSRRGGRMPWVFCRSSGAVSDLQSRRMLSTTGLCLPRLLSHAQQLRKSWMRSPRFAFPPSSTIHWSSKPSIASTSPRARADSARSKMASFSAGVRGFLVLSIFSAGSGLDFPFFALPSGSFMLCFRIGGALWGQGGSLMWSAPCHLRIPSTSCQSNGRFTRLPSY
mmetsp:Transcript_18919/g.56729  ORF Transcript_18919/g.56729 Transcript_18919/m.56729 type:complete len:211 (-) Transcript_18919:1058-1690(-)